MCAVILALAVATGSPYRIKFEHYLFSSRQFHSVKRQALQALVVERLDIASRVDVESWLSFDASVDASKFTLKQVANRFP
jgi:hypothetical protein